MKRLGTTFQVGSGNFSRLTKRRQDNISNLERKACSGPGSGMWKTARVAKRYLAVRNTSTSFGEPRKPLRGIEHTDWGTLLQKNQAQRNFPNGSSASGFRVHRVLFRSGIQQK